MGGLAKRRQDKDPALGLCGPNVCASGGLALPSPCEMMVYRQGDAAWMTNL